MKHRGNFAWKLILSGLIFTLMFSVLSGVSFAEQSSWDCPECGRTGNTGNFCGKCAHPAPWIITCSPAETDALNGIVPCFGLTREQFTEKIAQLFDRTETWRKEQGVAINNLNEFPLLPDRDFIALSIKEYFGKSTNDECCFRYSLLSGELTESNASEINWYPENRMIAYNLSVIAYDLDKYYLRGQITVLYDDCWVFYSLSNLTANRSAVLQIQTNTTNGSVSTRYDHQRNKYPDCPLLDSQIE